jgi:hypothetical protein
MNVNGIRHAGISAVPRSWEEIDIDALYAGLCEKTTE